MAYETLVDSEIKRGRQLVAFLEQNGFDVERASWFYNSDAERWELIVATPQAETGSTALFRRAIDLGVPARLDGIIFVPLSDRVSQVLTRLAQSESEDGEGETRVRKAFSDGVYVEDAVVYRMAA